jgi:hypothetical protein
VHASAIVRHIVSKCDQKRQNINRVECDSRILLSSNAGVDSKVKAWGSSARSALRSAVFSAQRTIAAEVRHLWYAKALEAYRAPDGSNTTDVLPRSATW